MKFKGIYIFFCLIVAFNFLGAQQRPQYSQYLANPYLLNPALSGIENYVDLKLGHRMQWAGLEGAPKTTFISAHWALGDTYLWANPLSFEEKGDNPMKRSELQNYTASPAHHGLGFSVFMDKAAKLSNLNVNISYAYHLKLNQSLNLSLGTALGFSKMDVDVQALVMENPNDPAINTAMGNPYRPDLNIGLWLYGSSFFSGISTQQLIAKTNSNDKQGFGNSLRLVPHFLLISGYKFYVLEDIYAMPSVIAKYVNHTPLSFDINLKLGFKDRLWLGIGYRDQDALNFMAGFNINQFMNVSYGYDLTTSPLNTASRGSHELVLGIMLNNVYRVICPQKIW